MVNAQRIGNTIVVNWNGKLYNKSFPDIEQREKIWEFLANASEFDDEDEVKFKLYFQTVQTESEKQMQLEFEKKKEESKKMKDILDFMKEVRDGKSNISINNQNIFEVIGSSLYIKGINISTPELLIREIMKAGGFNEDYDINPERLNALLNFWKLCALNPDPRARFDLFKFLVNHNLTLTPSGNFVAYRTVDKFKSGNEELEKFVTQEWLKIKRWKKSPKNYWVFQDFYNPIYYITSSEINDDGQDSIGNLDELYNNIGETSGNVYTDAYTGTFRIKMGELVSMEREKVNPDPELACEAGLHCGNESFMRANMGYFGKVGIVVLINPKDVTSVPKHDTGKMRTCKYLPIAIAETDENGHIVPVDVDVFDLEMAQNTQEELEKMAELSSTELEEYKKHEFIAPEVDFQMLDNIYESVTMSINDANNKIKDRVIKI